MKKIKLFEAFAGIGAQHEALKNLYGQENVEVVGMFEWYLDAIIAYETMHNALKIDKKTPKLEMIDFLSQRNISTNSKEPVNKKYWSRIKEEKLRIAYSAVKSSEINNNNLFDITIDKTKITYPKNIDILTYSFPCQDLSVQGLHKGMNADSGTRSGLLWEIDKMLTHMFEYERESMPNMLVLENVKNMISKSHINEFKTWMKKLEKLGYKSKFATLNSKDFGSAQSRERVFCVSTRAGEPRIPVGDPLSSKKFLSVLEKEVEEKYIWPIYGKYHTQDFKFNPKSGISKTKLLNLTKFDSENVLYDINHCSPTLTASGANSRIKFLLKGQYRRIMPIEAYKLMGFKRSEFIKIKKLGYIGDARLLFTAGNSIPVQVLESIFKVNLDEQN